MVPWLLHTFGLDDGSGAWYLFWSGIVGDLALLGALLGAFRLANCHTSRCWRLGLHHVEGTPYRVCRKHHPTVPTGKVSLETIHAAHRKAHNK